MAENQSFHFINNREAPLSPLIDHSLIASSSGGIGAEISDREKAQLERDKAEAITDMIQFSLDLTGIVDPSFLSDGTNALISLSRGNWLDALISVVSIVPYIGDTAKLGKIHRYLESIRKAIKIAKKDSAWAIALKNFLEPLRKYIDQLIKLLTKPPKKQVDELLNKGVIENSIDDLLEKSRQELLQIKDEIDRFIPSSMDGAAPGGKIANPKVNPANQAKQARKPRVEKPKDDGIIGDGVKNAGIPLSKAKIDEIIATPKGKRPLPEEYLSEDYIKNHLSQFDEGSARIVSKKGMQDFGTAGPDPSFVMPKPYVDKVIKEANGDIGKIEEALGFPKGSLDPDDMMIAEIPATKNIKIPSGNEDGANVLWEPGGLTSGGVPEAVMSLPPISDLKIKPLIGE